MASLNIWKFETNEEGVIKFETKEESNKTISSSNTQATGPKESMPSDEMFVPEVISIPHVLDTASASGTNLIYRLDTSPILYQIEKEYQTWQNQQKKNWKKSLKEHRNN